MPRRCRRAILLLLLPLLLTPLLLSLMFCHVARHDIFFSLRHTPTERHITTPIRRSSMLTLFRQLRYASCFFIDDAADYAAVFAMFAAAFSFFAMPLSFRRHMPPLFRATFRHDGENIAAYDAAAFTPPLYCLFSDAAAASCFSLTPAADYQRQARYADLPSSMVISLR